MKQIFTTFFFFGICTLGFTQCDVNGIYLKAYLMDPGSAAGSANKFDTDQDGTVRILDEFVQICNSSVSSVNVGTYTISDSGSYTYTIPTGTTIDAGNCLTLVTRWVNGTPPSYILNWNRGSAVWNNTGPEKIIISDGTTTCSHSIFSTPYPTQVGCVTVINGSSGAVDCSITPSDLGGNPLPVEWLYFNARRISKNIIHLKWATASELNNQLFEIEQSQDASSFETIGSIAGRGTTNEISKYQFEAQVFSEINYFRIKQIDFDGKFEYSYIVKLDEASTNAWVKQTNDKILINASSNDYSYTIINELGQELVANKINGSITLEKNTLRTGIYTLLLHNQDDAKSYKIVVY